MDDEIKASLAELVDMASTTLRNKLKTGNPSEQAKLAFDIFKVGMAYAAKAGQSEDSDEVKQMRAAFDQLLGEVVGGAKSDPVPASAKDRAEAGGDSPVQTEQLAAQLDPDGRKAVRRKTPRKGRSVEGPTDGVHDGRASP